MLVGRYRVADCEVAALARFHLSPLHGAAYHTRRDAKISNFVSQPKATHSSYLIFVSQFWGAVQHVSL
jgi:hypothetical protein